MYVVELYRCWGHFLLWSFFYILLVLCDIIESWISLCGHILHQCGSNRASVTFLASPCGSWLFWSSYTRYITSLEAPETSWNSRLWLTDGLTYRKSRTAFFSRFSWFSLKETHILEVTERRVDNHQVCRVMYLEFFGSFSVQFDAFLSRNPWRSRITLKMKQSWWWWWRRCRTGQNLSVSSYQLGRRLYDLKWTS